LDRPSGIEGARCHILMQSKCEWNL